jgi:thioredoxin reductase (NADPH)
MEAIGRDLREMLRVPLASSHVATLLRAGIEVCYEAGDFLTQPGRPIDRFTYILEGERGRECFHRRTTGAIDSAASSVHGGNSAAERRQLADADAGCHPDPGHRSAPARDAPLMPDMSDIVITVLAARRRRHLESRESSLALIGEDVDRAVRACTVRCETRSW